jgi:hypothetical protein
MEVAAAHSAYLIAPDLDAPEVELADDARPLAELMS